jgi:hypothetical protein
MPFRGRSRVWFCFTSRPRNGGLITFEVLCKSSRIKPVHSKIVESQDLSLDVSRGCYEVVSAHLSNLAHMRVAKAM